MLNYILAYTFFVVFFHKIYIIWRKEASCTSVNWFQCAPHTHIYKMYACLHTLSWFAVICRLLLLLFFICCWIIRLAPFFEWITQHKKEWFLLLLWYISIYFRKFVIDNIICGYIYQVCVCVLCCFRCFY